jgi:hypothetical protein
MEGELNMNKTHTADEVAEIKHLEDEIALAAFHGMNASGAVQRLTALLTKQPKAYPTRRFEF